VKRTTLLITLTSVFSILFSQDSTKTSVTPPAPKEDHGQISGNLEVIGQYYNPDTSIGAPPVPEKFLLNAYCNLTYTRGHFSAGMRYESYLNALQGYDPRYSYDSRNKGIGIPFRYASYKVDDLEVTVGSYYEQFGSGLILRIYEERGLGIDNALDGIRLKYTPFRGIYLKALIGRQRFFFNYGPGIVRGFDGEMNMNELIKKWEEKKTRIILAGSFVSKFQADANPSLILPENVGNYGGRMKISRGNFTVSGEYAYKINDPSYDNTYIYNHGDAVLLQMSYSKKGIALLLGMKRVDNMSYKSDRDMPLLPLTINFNPALVRQHTYGLLAFYPYASQIIGELGWQGEFLYKVKKDSRLGGKYGMDININYSSNYGLDTTGLEDSITQIPYSTNYFGHSGNMYWQDINLEITKKFSKKFKGTFIIADQFYDITQIQAKFPAKPDVHSIIAVADLTYRVTDDHALRVELQHLYTEKETKSWALALVEFTIGERFYLTASDQYNYGNPDEKKRFNFVNFVAGYVKNATRISLGYGKQRSGIFCAGGVCRFVPASNGFIIQVSTGF